MIKPPSLVGEMSLIYSGDPALVQPPDAPADDADAEAKTAHESAVAAHEAELQRARDTGRWESLIREGQAPTIFHIKPLSGTTLDWWIGETQRRQLIWLESSALALRLALKNVTNLGAYKPKVEKNEDGFPIADPDIIDAIYASAGDSGRSVVLELGAAVVQRARNPLSPKR